MDNTPLLMYSFLDATHYENIERYVPTSEYYEVARQILPQDWVIKQRAFWTMCTPPGWASIKHGWKIHISSQVKNALETLSIVAALLAKESIAFKFCSDPRMLRMSTRKTWSRFQVGKAITIYPADEQQFKGIIEQLYEATRHLVGPHILTDRAYRDSRVVYYRYGAHAKDRRTDRLGTMIAGFTLDDGTWYEDIRGPQFRLPPGCADPFKQEQPTSVSPSKQPIMLANRYEVRAALKFNATGGVYVGTDTHTGREIVIHEVRGLLGHMAEATDDPVFALKRQARIQEKLTPTGLVPAFIDLFQEWQNWFLVEERLDAATLWNKSMEFYYANEFQKLNFGLHKMRETIKTIAEGLKIVHAHGVVLRDMTKNNVMFTPDGAIKFIDLEFAFELDDPSELWVRGWTPGYASKEQAQSRRPVPADDHYAFGVLILDILTFCSTGFDLGREAILEKKLKQVLCDLALPMALYELVKGLTARDAEQRWDLDRVLAHLDTLPESTDEVHMFPLKSELLNMAPPQAPLLDQLEVVQQGLQNYLDAVMDLSRKDRLWPASPMVYLTNPVSIQYGAAGTAFYLLRSRGSVDGRILDWIEERAAHTLSPMGLYAGLSGVALLMLESGRLDSARRQMQTILSRSEQITCPSLYFGLAGWGLVNLHFWKATGDKTYLDLAVDIGNQLIKQAEQGASGIYWPNEGKIFLGLGDGQSGIALFLTYLAAASGDARFTAAAAQALDYDIAHGIRIAGRITWRYHVDSPDSDPNLPHMRFGSAGVGTACIRHFALTGDPRFKEVALDCAYSVRSRVTNKIWQDSGIACYGEYLLDMAHFLDEPRFRDVAYYQAEALLPHALEYAEGIAFAGTDHHRICCDFSMGGAGIGIFLDRLSNRRGRFMMLDELLKPGASAISASASQMAALA